MKPTLVIVLGMSGAGKTTLAKKISEELNLPLVSKDDLKVMAFDSLGWKDREWSIKIGNLCYSIMDYIAENQLKTGRSIILESTFDPKFAELTIRNWQNKYEFKVMQIYCSATPEIARNRLIDRANSDIIHVSQAEGDEALKNFDYRLRNNVDRPLDIESEVIELETTDFGKIDEDKVIQKIKAYLS